MSRFFLEVYGCQMNRHEAGIVRRILSSAGYSETSDENEADVLLMLTCSVRDHAEQRALGRLGDFRGLKERSPGRVVAVLGCVSQNLKAALSSDHGADLVVGPDGYRRLPELLASVLPSQSRIQDPKSKIGSPVFSLDQSPECYDGIMPVPESPVSGSVTVTRGCDNYCSYCIVPFVRGRERSKPAAQVLAEARSLLDQGVKEVTLLGQNVLAYRSDGCDFSGLLQQVAAMPGIARVRFLTSHPRDVTERFLETIADTTKVCPALHLPLQSGSDRILELMNRRYTRAEYLERVELARKLIPGLGLTTDIIVGFPQETDADYAATLELVRTIGYHYAYMFRYSVRPGTASEQMGPAVPDAVAQERLKRLIALQNDITRAHHRSLVGRRVELMVEGVAPRGGMTARTGDGTVVIVPGPVPVGTIRDFTVTRISGWTPVAGPAN